MNALHIAFRKDAVSRSMQAPKTAPLAPTTLIVTVGKDAQQWLPGHSPANVWIKQTGLRMPGKRNITAQVRTRSRTSEVL